MQCAKTSKKRVELDKILVFCFTNSVKIDCRIEKQTKALTETIQTILTTYFFL